MARGGARNDKRQIAFNLPGATTRVCPYVDFSYHTSCFVIIVTLHIQTAGRGYPCGRPAKKNEPVSGTLKIVYGQAGDACPGRVEHDNHPIELSSPAFTQQKIDYIHQNPVEAGLVYRAEDYIYWSASNYADLDQIIDVDCLFFCNKHSVSVDYVYGQRLRLVAYI